MDDKQFKRLVEELSDIKNLLVLNALKVGATSDEIGKCIGVSGRQVRNILSESKKKRK